MPLRLHLWDAVSSLGILSRSEKQTRGFVVQLLLSKAQDISNCIDETVRTHLDAESVTWSVEQP